jgi:glycosyltransferase involved in cell wall biosynthesis
VSNDLGREPQHGVLERLWVISEVYYPEETSTGYYLTAIAEGLTDRFDVKVLCGQPNYYARGTRAPKRETHKNVDIYRVAGTTLSKNVIALKLINMVTLSLLMFFKGLINFRRGNKILVVTTPPTMPFIVALASLIRGCSYTLLIHDCYPEVLVAVGKLKRNSVAVRSIDFFNRWLYKHARKIVVVGRDMKELVANKSSGLEIPIEIIPNWAELDDVRPQPRSQSELIGNLGINDRLILLHAGNIGYPTDVETIIELLKRLERDSRFHFVFIGSGVKRQLLENAIDELGFQNLTLLAPRPRSEQIDFLNACDVGLVSMIPNMYGAAMPSKTYNIMAAGKPILALADAESELALVVDENDIGWHLLPGNVDLLLDTLNSIFERRDELESKGRLSRLAAERDYSISLALERYRSALS